MSEFGFTDPKQNPRHVLQFAGASRSAYSGITGTLLMLCSGLMAGASPSVAKENSHVSTLGSP